MSDSLREFLDGYRMGGGGGGGRASFLRIKESGRYKYRLYRWASPQGPQLMSNRAIHFTGEGPPVECVDPCPICDVVAKLEAEGSPDNKQRAKDMRRVRETTFSVVPIANPVEFGFLPVTEATAQKILCAVAEVGGYVGAFPRSEGDKAQFMQALEVAIPQVCGPHGKDLIVVYDKTASPANRYIAKVAQVGSAILPQEEGADVPNPADARARIAQVRAKKQEG
jgi:hypothetical protein